MMPQISWGSELWQARSFWKKEKAWWASAEVGPHEEGEVAAHLFKSQPLQPLGAVNVSAQFLKICYIAPNPPSAFSSGAQQLSPGTPSPYRYLCEKRFQMNSFLVTENANPLLFNESHMRLEIT